MLPSLRIRKWHLRMAPRGDCTTCESRRKQSVSARPVSGIRRREEFRSGIVIVGLIFEHEDRATGDDLGQRVDALPVRRDAGHEQPANGLEYRILVGDRIAHGTETEVVS